MNAVCLIDTSVFVNILRVPNKSADHAEIMAELELRIAEGQSLFLPMATVFETGNHIGQNGDGNQRRQCAARFVRQVELAMDGASPFTPIDFVEADRMRQWLDGFPDWAMQGSGLGDLSIVHDWERLCEQNKGRRVLIWSLDGHLAGYDRGPEL
jgi:predicted nucleic acid-binding protein